MFLMSKEPLLQNIDIQQHPSAEFILYFNKRFKDDNAAPPTVLQDAAYISVLLKHARAAWSLDVNLDMIADPYRMDVFQPVCQSSQRNYALAPLMRHRVKRPSLTTLQKGANASCLSCKLNWPQDSQRNNAGPLHDETHHSQNQ